MPFIRNLAPDVAGMMDSRISISGREMNTPKAPAYRITPLCVAHSASETRTEHLPLIGLRPLKAVPLIEVLLSFKIVLGNTDI
jgi:hypothetical protein